MNPESGTISYSYDNDGNVLTKTHPMMTTCWGNLSGTSCDNSGYDVLNEATLKSYSNGTPAVSYSYANGRLMQVSNSVSTTSFGYDGLGRVGSSQQQTLGQAGLQFQYDYNLTDAMTSETYPAGRIVATSYDGSNRVTDVAGLMNDFSTFYVDRVDKGIGPFEKDHVHFTDDSALNSDGTWKHGGWALSNKKAAWITSNGWSLPR